MIKPGDEPPRGGLYLMDVVPDGEVRFGFPNISDNAEIVEMMASGAHCTLFVTGRGSVVGSALAPYGRRRERSSGRAPRHRMCLQVSHGSA